MPEKSFNKLDAFPAPDNNVNFEKNFFVILRGIKKDQDLLPIQEEKAQKIFNDCINAGLTPTDPDSTEQIIKKIIDGLQNLKGSPDMKISGDADEDPEKPRTSSTGASFSG